MIKTIFITGTTSGIGLNCAQKLALPNHRLILCGRRKDRLAELAKTLDPLCAGVHTAVFDVSDPEAVVAAIAGLPPDFAVIDVLINNAGNAHGLAGIHEGDLSDWQTMIDVNIKGLLYVSKPIIKQMVARKTGHIINIGSVAGRQNYANGNVYCATKHAVVSLSESMRLDLNPFGIKVTCIDPGLTETEFSLVRFKDDKERAKTVYNGFRPLTGADIAELIEFVISRPAHVNIADVLILPTAQANATTVKKV